MARLSACSGKVDTGFSIRTCANAKSACSGKVDTGFPIRTCANAKSACSGKVDTSFPIRTCTNAKEAEHIPNHSIGIFARAACALTIAVTALASAAGAAGGEPRDQDARSIEEDLLSGRFEHLATLIARKANAGEAEAQYQLGSLYRSGRGVPPDEALAFKWMKAAAEQGHVRAEFNLGAMYLAGRGVARDLDQGRKWLAKAAAQGSQEARLLLSSPAARPAKKADANKPATAAQSSRAPSLAPAALVDQNGRSLILDAAARGQTDAIRPLRAGGEHQERSAARDRGLRFCAPADQRRYDRGLTATHRDRQRVLAVGACGRHAGALFQEPRHRLGMAPGGGQHQRRLAALVYGVDYGGGGQQ